VKGKRKPVEQGKSPISGTRPPAEHQFKPGQSGNPQGRKTAGASIREWINWLSEKKYTETKLRLVARDRDEVWTKRAAAERILRTLEAGDLADFAGLLRGENNLEDLRGMGINTEVVKKIKQKTRRVPGGKDANGKDVVEEIIEREIELHDRAGPDFDRVVDQTAGKPQQNVDHTSGGQPFTLGPIKLEGEREL
jgi:hypothetical protein